MNTKTTWIFLSLAAGLFAFILFDHQPDRPAAPPRPGTAPLFPILATNSILMVEVDHTNHIRAERLNDQWRLVTPPYPAQANPIETLIASIGELREQGFVSPQDLKNQDGGLAPFGLNPPQTTIKLQDKSNRFHFHVGRTTPLGDQVYVQIIGSAGVHVIDAGFLRLVPRTADQWRDPMLLDLSTGFNRIEVQTGTRGFELQFDRTNQLWRLTKPQVVRADANRVENLIHSLRLARVDQFVADDPRVDLEPFGLLSPEVELTLALGTNPVAQIQFGRSPTNLPSNVFARRLAHSNVVLVARELVDELKQSSTTFRDRTLLTFNPTVVDRIEIRAEENFTLQKQPGGAWQILEPLGIPADRMLVQQFLTNLSQIEIVEFEKEVVTDFTAYGLAPAAGDYTLKTLTTNGPVATNQIVAQLGFSTNGVQPGRPGMVFARREDENSVYSINSSDAERLPRFAFELRDRRIGNFQSSNVTSIAVSKNGVVRKLARDPVRGWTGVDVGNAAIEEILHRIGQLTAVDRWVGRGDALYRQLHFPDVAYRVSLELSTPAGPQIFTIEFGGLSPRGNPYAAVILPGEPQRLIFQFPARLYADVVRELNITPPPGQ